jgi:FKBP-type peptidyl-prolyl cis-trans isomerase 2
MDMERSRFEAQDVQAGMSFTGRGQDGTCRVFRVTSADETRVSVDANHPLAGLYLTLDVVVEAVGKAPEGIGRTVSEKNSPCGNLIPCKGGSCPACSSSCRAS